MTMMKQTLLLVLFSFALPGHAHTEEVKFSYAKLNKELTLSGALCTYGRKSKQKLPESVISHIHNHVKDQNKNFIDQIRDIKTGMFGRRLNMAELAVMYQLTDKHLELDYYFEGNSACVNFQARLELDFNADANMYFNFAQPDSWTFMAKRNDLADINQAIKLIYPKLSLSEQDLSAATQSYLIELSQVSDTYALYKFDAQGYTSSQSVQLNTFYVEAPAPYKAAMTDYLTSYQYSTLVDKNQANWQITVNPVKSAQNLLFTVSYQSKDDQNKQVNNDPDALPQIVTNNQQELKNLILLHLEMMEFVNVLQK